MWENIVRDVHHCKPSPEYYQHVPNTQKQIDRRSVEVRHPVPQPNLHAVLGRLRPDKGDVPNTQRRGYWRPNIHALHRIAHPPGEESPPRQKPGDGARVAYKREDQDRVPGGRREGDL